MKKYTLKSKVNNELSYKDIRPGMIVKVDTSAIALERVIDFDYVKEKWVSRDYSGDNCGEHACLEHLINTNKYHVEAIYDLFTDEGA